MGRQTDRQTQTHDRDYSRFMGPGITGRLEKVGTVRDPLLGTPAGIFVTRYNAARGHL